MPFVDYPIECVICRGKGQITPLSTFTVNVKIMESECLNCRGAGTLYNKVYVNPMPEVLPKNNKLTFDDSTHFISLGKLPTDEKIYEPPIDTSKECENIITEVKKIKYSKKNNLPDSQFRVMS